MYITVIQSKGIRPMGERKKGKSIKKKGKIIKGVGFRGRAQKGNRQLNGMGDGIERRVGDKNEQNGSGCLCMVWRESAKRLGLSWTACISHETTGVLRCHATQPDKIENSLL